MLLGSRVTQRTLASPALWVTWDRSYHVPGLQFPFRQRKATRETWQGCSEELVGKRPGWTLAPSGCQSGLPGGGPLAPQRCSHLLLQPVLLVLFTVSHEGRVQLQQPARFTGSQCCLAQLQRILKCQRLGCLNDGDGLPKLRAHDSLLRLGGRGWGGRW